MARNEKFTVELSTHDRALLKQLIKAVSGEELLRTLAPLLTKIAPEETDEELEARGLRRLVETYPDDLTGAIEEHFNWSGNGWMPKPGTGPLGAVPVGGAIAVLPSGPPPGGTSGASDVN